MFHLHQLKMKRFQLISLILISFTVSALGEENGTNYEECVSYEEPNPSTIKRCPFENHRKGCFWRINTNERDQGGCVSDLSDVEKESCRPENPDCGICFGDKCNHSSFKNPCAVCESTNDKNCISMGKDVPLKYCEDYTDECYTFLNRRKQEIQRGCLHEANKTIIDYCSGKRNGQNEDNDFDCIIPFIIGDQKLLHTCFKCDSDIDSNCIDKPIFTEEFICSTDYSYIYPYTSRPVKGCYYYKNGDRVKRGCVRDLPNDFSAEEYQEYKNGSEKFHICTQNNCNQKNVIQQKCYKCDGHDDEKCVTGESNRTTICMDYSMSCYARDSILDGGYMHRGCTDKKESGICFGDYCNNFITPPNRLRCYQCDGGPECTQDLSSIKPKPCQIMRYDIVEDCYARVANDGNIYRGCLYAKSESSRECFENSDKCKTCHSSGCNDFNRTIIEGE